MSILLGKEKTWPCASPRSHINQGSFSRGFFCVNPRCCWRERPIVAAIKHGRVSATQHTFSHSSFWIIVGFFTNNCSEELPPKLTTHARLQGFSARALKSFPLCHGDWLSTLVGCCRSNHAVFIHMPISTKFMFCFMS